MSLFSGFADRISRAVDSAIEAVIGAVIDHILREWAEEMAQAAKEEGQCGCDHKWQHHVSPGGCCIGDCECLR